MLTWQSLCAHLSDLGTGWHELGGLLVAHDVDGRGHNVYMRLSEERDAIEIRAVVGNEADFSFRAALRYNRGLRLGAIVVDEHQLMVFRIVLPFREDTFD